MSSKRHAQFCALARAADIVGERWTLLIVRELLLGPKRFADLSARLEAISSALLASRLDKLLKDGLIRRVVLVPPASGGAYELTELGQALRPAVHELIRWGGRFLFPMRRGDKFEPEWISLALEAIARRENAPDHELLVVVEENRKTAQLRVTGGSGGTKLSLRNDQADATIRSRFDVLLRVIARDLSLNAAREVGLVVTGSVAAARRLPDYFDLRRPPSPPST